MSTQVKGIIWDFGNILAEVDHMIACKRLSLHCLPPTSEIRDMLFGGEIAPAKEHESGLLSPEEFFTAVLNRLSLTDEELPYETFHEIWRNIFRERHGVAEVIGKVRSNIRQCVLSNTDPIHWTAIEQLPVMKRHFSDPASLVRSYEMGTRKPDVKMYREALSRLGLTDKDIVDVLYIDDVPEYCECFRQMGGNVITYDCWRESPEQLEEKLKEFDVL